MKTISFFRSATVAAMLLMSGASLSNVHAAAAPDSDPAAERLTHAGMIPVNAAGPYVERGTFRIQVLTKLGKPSAVLRDGSWLYDQRTVEGSAARGSLLIQFKQGRVSELALVTPSLAMALRENPHRPQDSRVATK